jgi:integrase
LFLNTEKSGSKIYVPVPTVAVEALRQIENGSAYFFWTGNGLRKSAVADWQRALRRLFKLADIKGNPHMFRHTFATDQRGARCSTSDFRHQRGWRGERC